MPLTQIKAPIKKSFILVGVVAVVAIIVIGIVLRALSMNQDARSQAAKYRTDVSNTRKSARRTQETENPINNTKNIIGEKPKVNKTPKEQTTKKKVRPLYVQYHTWWGVPWSSSGSRRYDYWSYSTDIGSGKTYTGEPWHRVIMSLNNPLMRNSTSNVSSITKEMKTEQILDLANAGSYPYLGLYDSADPEIMKYDIIAAKNAGIDALSVSVFDVYSDTVACPKAREPMSRGGLQRFQRMLDVAQAQNYKLFLEYWIPLNPSSKDTNVCGSHESYKRGLVATLKATANHPAYLKIDGRPVVSPAGFAGYQPILQDTETQTGLDVYWMMRSISPDEYQNDNVDAIVAGALLKGKQFLAKPDYAENSDYVKNLMKTAKDKPFGLHIYPGFDDTFRTARNGSYAPMGMKRVDADGNNVLAKQLDNANAYGTDFIWLESWNDFSEQTAIGPKVYALGEKQSDPFADLRIIATFKGKTFTPPPLPPRTSIDPLMAPVLFK